MLNTIKFLNIKGFLYNSLCVNNDRYQDILALLIRLDISDNILTMLRSFCLVTLKKLQVLLAQRNKISVVQDNSFSSLKSLNLLDLSDNKIAKLTGNLFVGLANINLINLTLNSVLFVSLDTFTSVPPETIYSINIKACCSAGVWSNCQVKNNRYLRCTNLLPNYLSKYICWNTSIFVLLVNISAFILNFIFIKITSTNTFLDLSLKTIDGCFGMSLLAVATADLFYNGNYIGSEILWRSSIVCKLSSLLVLVSLTASPILICLIMVSRFCIICWPISSKFLQKSFIESITIGILSIIGMPYICLLLAFYGIQGHKAPTGICLILYMPGQKSQSPIVFFITITIIVILIVSSIVVLILWALFAIILDKSQRIAPQKNKKWNTKGIKHQISMIAVTNLCCWVPTCAFYMFSISNHAVSHSLLVWLTVCVLPINCLLDPLFFTFMSPKLKVIFKRYVNSFTQIENKL